MRPAPHWLPSPQRATDAPAQDPLQALADGCLAACARRAAARSVGSPPVLETLRFLTGTAARQSGAAHRFLAFVIQGFERPLPAIRLDCDPDLELPFEALAALGLIAAEAVSNALRYAFPAGRDGHIWLRLVRDEGRIRFTVRDDGIGVPDLPPDPQSGRGVIDALARHLGGYARLGSAPFGGALVTVIYTPA